MKLLTKTTLAYLAVMLVVFGIGGYIAYKQAILIVQEETEYALRQDLRIIMNAISEGVPIEALENRKVKITKMSGPGLKETEPVFSDTLVFTQYTGQDEPHRMIDVVREVDGSFFRFKMYDLFIELGDMSEGISRLMIQLFLSLAAAMILFSILFSRYLFRPFQHTLEKIKTFRIDRGKDIVIPKSSTKEFEQLNKFVSGMARKAISDYKSLKEFTENASHEMQTPLAVATGKLELLMESENLTSDQAKLVEASLQSLNKLSRMGQALSLLTKIENNEFFEKEPFDFSKLLKESVEQFQELGAMKGIDVELLQNGAVNVEMNKTLAEIMVNNLLKNAIQHNVKNGWVRVEAGKDVLKVTNSGDAPTVPTHELIKRFKKSRPTSGSSGLGLAIVKNICDVSNFKLNYTFHDKMHEIWIDFMPDTGPQNQVV